MSATPRFTILYEDTHLIAVDKGAGQLVVPGRGKGSGEALVAILSRRLGRKVFVVHRIDKDTSGIVLFAKDAETHRVLSMVFEKREVGKTYLALVEGEVPSGGTVKSPLKERGSGRISVHPQGKPAETLYKPLKQGTHSSGTLRSSGQGGKTLLEVHPLTGRRHQIRVHLYSIGHRIVGDPLYGEMRAGEGRLMLHAWKLALPAGPWGEGRMFEAPIPETFRF